MSRKIAVYTEENAEWINELDAIIPNDWCVDVLTPHNFLKEIKDLLSRRRKSRADEGEPVVYTGNLFDEADMVIIDYPFVEESSEFYTTGENVTYLLRSYSTCGYIVAVDQFRTTSTFDLMLNGRLNEFADLHVCAGDVASPGLWRNDWDHYRPSTWPHLPDAPSKYAKRIESIKHCLDVSVVDFFQFPSSAIGINDDLAAFLDAAYVEFSKVTFIDFVKTSTHALRPNDRQDDKDMVARIAAARIYKWLEFGVLPSQNILIDPPHLATKVPALVKGVPWGDDSWYGLSTASLDFGLIEDCRFSHSAWLSRPAWFWQEVRDLPIANPSSRQNNIAEPFVFCEDSSRFVQETKATLFSSGLFTFQHVESLEDVFYVPSFQL